MGERTQYTPGTFCWADLATTDQEAAKAFYGELFGWQAEDMPVGDGSFYSMMRLDGKNVAAIATQPQQQRDAGVPPVWQSYVSVESADGAADRARELGGTVHAPPFDVLEAGRMAVIQDPQGAYFMVWQPRGHIGAQLVNGPGALSWDELSAPDLDAAAEFYGGLFGWTVSPFEGSAQRYLTIQNDGRGNGGMREPQPGEPPNWLVYFGADDVAAALATVEQLGGGRLSDPVEIGVGTIGIARDAQGAIFALYAGQFEP